MPWAASPSAMALISSGCSLQKLCDLIERQRRVVDSQIAVAFGMSSC